MVPWRPHMAMPEMTTWKGVWAGPGGGGGPICWEESEQALSGVVHVGTSCEYSRRGHSGSQL